MQYKVTRPLSGHTKSWNAGDTVSDADLRLHGADIDLAVKSKTLEAITGSEKAKSKPVIAPDATPDAAQQAPEQTADAPTDSVPSEAVDPGASEGQPGDEPTADASDIGGGKRNKKGPL